jgi:hypothetical protein
MMPAAVSMRLGRPALVNWCLAGNCFMLTVRTHGAQIMTQGTVQLVAGILAVVLIAIVILRRKGKKSKQEDDF